MFIHLNMRNESFFPSHPCTTLRFVKRYPVQTLFTQIPASAAAASLVLFDSSEIDRGSNKRKERDRAHDGGRRRDGGERSEETDKLSTQLCNLGRRRRHLCWAIEIGGPVSSSSLLTTHSATDRPTTRVALNRFVEFGWLASQSQRRGATMRWMLMMKLMVGRV